MDALDEDRLVASGAQLVRFFAALARDEIELRRFDFLALQQRHQVFAQQLQIQRVRVFQVALAVFVHGDGVAVEIIIVQRNLHGQMPHGPQQDGEPVRHRGLARRGRTGDKHDFYLFLFLDLVSDLGDLFLVQGFAYLDHIPGVFMFDGLV